MVPFLIDYLWSQISTMAVHDTSQEKLTIDPCMNYRKCGQKLVFPLLSDSLYENFAFTPYAVHANHNNIALYTYVF